MNTSIKKKYILILGLLILTSTIVPNFWQLGMTGMIGFFLAYLTKGSRKVSQKGKGQGGIAAKDKF